MNQEIINNITSSFYSNFKKKPLRVASPGRINLIGEHTDYNNGFVLPAAINKYIYAAIEKSDSISSCTVIALDAKEQVDFDLSRIEAIDKGGWRNYILGVVGELQKYGKQIESFNFVFAGDIPIGAGLSSSAALENSLVFALNELFELALSKMEMIKIAQKAEHNYAAVKCGIMDQFASMMGAKNHALFLDCRSMEYEAVPLDLGEYTLLLLNTNVAHNLATSAYNDRRSSCEKAVEILQKKNSNLLINSLRDVIDWSDDSLQENLKGEQKLYARSRYVLDEFKRVQLAKKALQQSDLDLLGHLLFESHQGLQNLYEVSCSELDFLVAKAQLSEAVIGARMMGGGFGGCTINLIEKEAIDIFVKTTKKDYQQTYNKELSAYKVQLAKGSQLI